MPGFVFQKAMEKLVTSQIDMVNDDIRIMLLNSGTTVFVEENVEFLNEFTTLNDAAGTRQVMAGTRAWVSKFSPPNTNGVLELTSDDPQPFYPLLNVGVIDGYLIYKHVTDDTDSIPISCFDGKFIVHTTGASHTYQAGTTEFEFSPMGFSRNNFSLPLDMTMTSLDTGQDYDVRTITIKNNAFGYAVQGAQVFFNNPSLQQERSGRPWLVNLDLNLPFITNGSDFGFNFKDKIGGILNVSRPQAANPF